MTQSFIPFSKIQEWIVSAVSVHLFITFRDVSSAF